MVIRVAHRRFNRPESNTNYNDGGGICQSAVADVAMVMVVLFQKEKNWWNLSIMPMGAL